MALNKGQMVDNRYRVVKLLGQGGMGAVYRAWDTRLDVAVALKEMVPQFNLNAEMLAGLRQQFQQEAKILATLSHPSLVRVTDYFSWSGNEYLVMDFVEGESLADRIASEGAQTERQVVAWAKQLLDALSYCHGRGVIHRDIKPQNIIITPEGRAVLVDFGLVKLWDPVDPQTRTVMRGAGTPEYAPPEQYDMGAGHTDPRSDVYSMGATLYHALTGEVPPTATQRMASPASFRSPRTVNVTLGTQVEAAILKAMKMPMGQRYQSAGDMAEALAGGRPPVAVARPARVARVGRRAAAPAAGTAVPVREKEKGGRGILLGMGGVTLAIIGVICLLVAVLGTLWGLGVFSGATPTPTPTPTATFRPPTNTPPPPDTPVLVTDTPFPPTTTPFPTPSLFTSGLLFEDNFDDPDSGWDVKEYESGSVGYGEGYYYVTVVKEDTQLWGNAPQDFADVVVDVYATQVSAPANDNNAYGVMCRIQSDGGGYLLRISGDGSYAIQRVVDGSFQSLVDWDESAAINPGDATNHIRAVCDGNRLALFVNGELLAETEDDTYTEGGLGLTATTYEASPTEVHFDNLLVIHPAAILVQDSFGDPESGWEVGEWSSGSVGYDDGVYVVRSAAGGQVMWGAAGLSFDDVVIEVNATRVLGPTNDNDAYGVRCRDQDDGNDGYGLMISGDGSYAIFIVEGGSWRALVDWDESSAINQGDATNHIRAVCDGDRLALFVNGELLAETRDSTYTSGDIGLSAATFVEGEAVEVHFDDLLVYVP